MKEIINEILKDCKDKCKLIAVSKTKSVSDIKKVYDMGIRDFGENKVQELLSKIDNLPNDIRWHMIGHLQSNKVRSIIDRVYLIHSVDSLKLANIINNEAIKKNIKVNILCEINIANEKSKYGFSVNEFEECFEEINNLSNINLLGIMCVAPYQINSEDNREYFRKMNELKNKYNLLITSMGMSNDYKLLLKKVVIILELVL